MKVDSVEIPVQVNGKVRTKIQMPVGIGNEQAQLLAMSSPRVIELLDGKELLKVVVIPGKMINLVIKN